MKLISEYIAPWAIAKEAIPLHLIWESKENEFDFVEIDKPKNFEIREILNVTNYHLLKSKIKFSDKDLLSKDYFGLVISSNKTFDDLVSIFPITVRFLKNDKEFFSKTLNATIVRPKIRFKDPPSEIIIDDNTNLKKLLNFNIIHKGLGKVQLGFTASAKGDIISQSGSLYFDVLEEICNDLTAGKLKEESVNLKISEHEEFSFDPIMIQDHTTKILDMIKSGNFPSTVRREIFKELCDIANDPQRRNGLIKVIYSKLQRLFISYLLYYFDRNPHEDIELPVGKINVNLNFGIKLIILKITYTDSYDNTYEPIESSLIIKDKRKNTEKFQIPINLNWASEPIQLGEIN